MSRRMLAAAIGGNAALALPWWVVLFAVPETRRFFLPASFPNEALLSFFAADALLFFGAGVLAAIGVAQGARWSRPVLWLHTGGACYAALYTLTQWALTKDAMLAALAMSPSLVLLPYACWRMEREP